MINRRRSRTRTVSVTLAALLAAGSVVACTGNDDDSPYATDLALALQNAGSDFEREVLSDGEITREEYEEAHQLWLACMRETYPSDGPLEVRLETSASGLYSYEIFIPAGHQDRYDEELFDRTNGHCSLGTIAQVAWLFNDMTKNPERLPFDDLLVRCLKENGFVDQSYTVDNLAADRAPGFLTPRPDDPDALPPPSYDPSLATGLAWDGPELEQCMIDVST